MQSFISGLMVAALALGAGVLHAEEPLDLEAMALGLKRNQESLKDFAWLSRVSYEVDGVPRRVDEYRVRYDDNGMLEKVQVSGEAESKKLRGADGKKLSKDEVEAARDFAFEVRSQLIGYLNPMFAEKAVRSSAVTEDGATLRLRSTDVVKPGDSVEIVLDRATRLPLSLRADSTVGDAPVALDVSFETLPYGPSHPVRSVTTSSWNGLELTITTEDSDYRRR